ncbi:MAG: agmatinase [Dehalococcoidia bacterium]|nr:agmatinase [Dehalococcoidia bacterium]
MTRPRPDDRFWPRYSFAMPPYPLGEYENARVVILPVPYDSTVTARAGAREGPNAIITNSWDMETFDVGLGYEPFLHGIYTAPLVAVTNESPEAMINRVHEIAAEFVSDGKFLVTLGGEHTIAVGSFRAHRDRYSNLSVFAIDAHADLRDEYQDTRYNHACSLRRMLDDAPVTQVGLRSAAVEEARLIKERNLPFYSPRDFRALPGLNPIVDSLSDHVYVTIDLDGIDSGEMPAVGTPEPAGLQWDEVSRLIEAIAAKKRIVGFDLMELAPDLGPKACSYAAAKLAYRLIGLALGPPEGS